MIPCHTMMIISTLLHMIILHPLCGRFIHPSHSLLDLANDSFNSDYLLAITCDYLTPLCVENSVIIYTLLSVLFLHESGQKQFFLESYPTPDYEINIYIHIGGIWIFVGIAPSSCHCEVCNAHCASDWSYNLNIHHKHAFLLTLTGPRTTNYY